jgi:hypothetical protein
MIDIEERNDQPKRLKNSVCDIGKMNMQRIIPPKSHINIRPNPSIKSYFKILSLPIGSKIKIKRDGSKFVPKEIDGKFGEIDSFKYAKLVVVEIINEGLYKVPFDNVELASDQKIRFFTRV